MPWMSDKEDELECSIHSGGRPWHNIRLDSKVDYFISTLPETITTKDEQEVLEDF